VITINIDKKLEISIQDDGVGFDGRNIRPFRNGLINMHKRMKDIRGRLEIIQKKGTLIIFSAPLPL
jgi:signal transduction histidine kinase